MACASIVLVMVVVAALAEGVCMAFGAAVFFIALLIASCLNDPRYDVKRFHAMRHCDLKGDPPPQGAGMRHAVRRPPPPPPRPEQ